jgi:hypothetical protein
LKQKIGYPDNLLNIHKGWFNDTVPLFANKLTPIAILRLDGDFYESTKLCLAHLYKNVVPGGFVIIDDYGSWQGCRVATNEFLQSLPQRPFLIRVNESCYYFIKQ